MSTYARCQSIAAVDVMVFQNVAMQYEEVVYGNESISICLLAFAIGIHSIWLHHMYWCGVLGEDYDGFICVMNSNLFLLTRMIVVSLCFPKFSQRGFYRGFILNECTLMMIFVQVFSQWGFLGLYFMVQSKTRSLSIGVPYWLEGSVWWYCCGIMFKCYSWLLHAVTCTRCVLIRIHAYSYASTRYEQDAYSYASTIYERDAYLFVWWYCCEIM